MECQWYTISMSHGFLIWFDITISLFFNFGLLSLVVKISMSNNWRCLSGKVCTTKRFENNASWNLSFENFHLFFFLVKIQWHYIPEHCITELENNIMYANFNLFQYAFARSSSNTQNLLSTIRSILEELYISNASSSGFDPHILCLTFSLYDVSKGTFNYTNFLFSTH